MKNILNSLYDSTKTSIGILFTAMAIIAIVALFVLVLFLIPFMIDTFHLSNLFLFLYVPLFIVLLWLIDKK